MTVVHLTCDENFQYFFYKGTPYRTGTIVKLNKSYTESHVYNGERIWEYAYFYHRVAPYGYSKYLFSPYLAPVNSEVCYSGFFRIDEKDMSFAIEEIVKPVHIQLNEKKKRKDTESPSVMVGWAILITVLFFSFVFTEWYLVWFWGLVVFFIWRSKQLWW
jgi:hypothetical protein